MADMKYIDFLRVFINRVDNPVDMGLSPVESMTEFIARGRNCASVGLLLQAIYHVFKSIEPS
jgi:hypothetical protein